MDKTKKEKKSIFGMIKKRLNSGGIMTLIFLAMLAGFAFYVNRNIRIDALYMDDLYMWSFYGEQSLFEFTFPFRTSVRFRPVYWFLTYLQMAAVGTNVSGYVTFNIIANIVLAWTVYGMGNRISRNRIAAFLAALVFLASRFSYYQIGQALGYMETLACFFSLHVLYFLFRYLTVPNDFCGSNYPENAPLFTRSDQRYFEAALFFYVLVSFTHERYITLFPLFYLVLVLKLLKEEKGNRKAWFEDTRFLWIIPALTVAAVMLIRFIFIGTSIPAGTGGTQVTETFSVSQTLRFCLSQVLYLLGVNDGPEYLCAIPWENTPENIKGLIKAGCVCYGLLGLAFVISMTRDLTGQKKTQSISVTPGQRRFCRKTAVSLLFAGFMGICILSSSVTVRLEMRWLYVSFAAMQLFACYMTLAVESLARDFRLPLMKKESAGAAEPAPADGSGRNSFTSPVILAATLLYTVYVVLSVNTNVFCRGYIDSIYFMEGQNRANSIAEQTVQTYGVWNVLGKTVFLVGTGYEISDFYCRYFFRPFDPEKTGQGTRLVLVDTVEEALEYLEKQQAGQTAKSPELQPGQAAEAGDASCTGQEEPVSIYDLAIFLTEDPATGKYIPLEFVQYVAEQPR